MYTLRKTNLFFYEFEFCVLLESFTFIISKIGMVS